MTSQTLPLNLIPKGVCPRLYVSQYDKGQEWNFDIYAGTEAYTIPSGSSVTIQGTKPDKTGFQYACSFSGNRVTATEQQQMTIIAGDVPAEIRIEKDNEIIATLNFIIVVEKAALADDTVISETDLPLIEEAIEVLGHADELVQRIEGDVTTSGNNALKAEGFAVGQQNGSDVASGSPYYHNSAKYYKEQAADSASTASNKASDASGSASAASGSASSASTNALKAEGFAVGQQNGSDVASGSPYYHNSAKYYKEQAADSASTASTKAGEAAASAQAAAQSAAHLTIDSAMSTTSENALQNKVITTTIQNLSNHNNINSSKNVAEQVFNSGTAGGITFTPNNDGSYSWSGTNTGSFVTYIIGKVHLKQGVKYWLSGGVSATIRVDLRVNYNMWTDNTESKEVKSQGSAVSFIPNSDADVDIMLRIQSQTNGSGTIKFMVCTDYDYALNTEWQPPALTNRQLTTDKVGMDLLSEVGAVNELLIRTSGNTVTSNNVYGSYNSDGTITLHGTASSNLITSIDEYKTYKAGTYKLSGAPSMGSSEELVDLTLRTSSNVWYGGAVNDRDGVIFTLPTDTALKLVIYVKGGTNVEGKVVKPMLTPISYNGPYVPPAKTNRELTEDTTKEIVDFSANTNLVGNTTYFKVRKYGKQIIFGGYLEVTATAAKNSTLVTLNTSYTIDVTSNSADNYYLILMDNAGTSYLVRMHSNDVVVESQNGIPSGNYAVIGAVVIN